MENGFFFLFLVVVNMEQTREKRFSRKHSNWHSRLKDLFSTFVEDPMEML